MASAGLATLMVAVRLREPGGRPRRLGAAADEVAGLRVVVRLRVVLAFRVVERAVPALARRAVALRRRVVARLVAGAVVSPAAFVCSDIFVGCSSDWGMTFFQHSHFDREFVCGDMRNVSAPCRSAANTMDIPGQ
jgi:hypothetical protein